MASCIQSLLSKNAIERVESVKSLGFYSRQFLVPKPHRRWRPVSRPKHLPTCRKVQNGNTRVHQGLSYSRGMGVVNRLIRRLPTHPHPPKLKEVPTVLPQVTGVPVHLPSFRTGHSPTGLYNACKTVKLMALARGIRLHQYLDDWLIRAQSQKEAQVNTQTVVKLTQSLGWIINQKKVRTKTCSSVFVRGLRIPSRFSPCKTHSREMAQTSGFDPTSQVKRCFDCKTFDVANWVARLNGENGPGGTTSHEALSVSPQGALEIFSVVGQPPSLDRNHFSTPRLGKSHKCDERRRPSSQRPQYPTFYRRLKRRLGCSLRASLHQGSVVRQGQKATHKCSRAEGSIPGPSKVQGPVSKPSSTGCYGQLNSGSLHKQTRRNPLGRDVCSPVENHDLVPSLQNNNKSQTHSV